MAEPNDTPLAEGEEEAAGRRGEDISPDKDGGVRKEILREGSGEDGPCAGDTVFVHYVGTLLTGEKFDSSRDRGDKFSFTLGKGQVIRGWDVGVATMKRGELCLLTCRSEYAYGVQGSPPKIPPNATLQFEVELFDWKGEDLSEDKDGSILRSTLETGQGYETPNDGATVEVHLIGKHQGTVFEERDLTFPLGEGTEAGVIEGVEIALQKFKKGERSKLRIKPRYAFGLEGNAEKGVPATAEVDYEVTLKSFEKCKESWEMEIDEKLEQCEIFKTKGTNYFKGGNLKLAMRYYKKVVDFLNDDLEDEEKKEQVQALVLASQLNLAMCHLKLKHNIEARDACDKAIELKADSEKAFFRRGQAELNLQNYDIAVSNFKRVLEIDPNNKAAKNQITLANAKIKQDMDREKKLYAGMFQKFAEKDSKQEESQANMEVNGDGDKNAVQAEAMETSST